MSNSAKSLVPLVPPVFKKILSLFPNQYFRYCFAYGSGVFSQGSAIEASPMVDLIFVVDDSIGFHGQNILINPSHYSFLKYFGHRTVTKVQEHWPAKVYFNTLIPIQSEKTLFKYGVVKRTDLINDLLDWNYLYLAGRLHKPVLNVIQPTTELENAIRKNLFCALHAALIILPQYFSERQLYVTIANLSYNGDFRMTFGEDKNKVINIVDNQFDNFRRLYTPLLFKMKDYVEVPVGGSSEQTCMQDVSSVTKVYHLFQLPKVAQQELAKYWIIEGRRKRKDVEDILRELSVNPDVGHMLSESLKPTVFNSSYQQSLKGILTAGITKSILYSNKKIKKMIRSI